MILNNFLAISAAASLFLAKEPSQFEGNESHHSFTQEHLFLDGEGSPDSTTSARSIEGKNIFTKSLSADRFICLFQSKVDCVTAGSHLTLHDSKVNTATAGSQVEITQSQVGAINAGSRLTLNGSEVETVSAGSRAEITQSQVGTISAGSRLALKNSQVHKNASVGNQAHIVHSTIHGTLTCPSHNLFIENSTIHKLHLRPLEEKDSWKLSLVFTQLLHYLKHIGWEKGLGLKTSAPSSSSPKHSLIELHNSQVDHIIFEGGGGTVRLVGTTPPPQTLEGGEIVP